MCCCVLRLVMYIVLQHSFLSSPPYKAAHLITLLLYFIVLYCTKARTSKVLCWCVKALIVLSFFSLFFYFFIFWNMIEPSERNHSTIVVGGGLSLSLMICNSQRERAEAVHLPVRKSPIQYTTTTTTEQSVYRVVDSLQSTN